MNIKGVNLQVNIEEELEPYSFKKARVRGSKLQCCSPFREDNSPSFAINLESGLWIDSGATDHHMRKGNLISFLANLQGTSYEEVEQYLIEKYSLILADTEELNLDFNLSLIKEKKQVVPESRVLENKQVSEYLSSRKISEDVQELFDCGIDKSTGAISLVWRDRAGNVANIKYRLISKKTFYYELTGLPITNHLYGLYQCIQAKAKRIWICEGEIDALTLWSAGEFAVALGCGSVSEKQLELILNSGAEEIVLATDNDGVGNGLRQLLTKELMGSIRIFDIVFPLERKDINELKIKELREVITGVYPVEISLNLHI